MGKTLTILNTLQSLSGETHMLSDIRGILEGIKNGEIGVDDALKKLKFLPFSENLQFPFEDTSFACIDHHRTLRQGFPEVIFGAGKRVQEVVKIVEAMLFNNQNVLVTKATPEMFESVYQIDSRAVYHQLAQIISIIQDSPLLTQGTKTTTSTSSVLIITAGTSDLPIAEEAAVTATIMGTNVDKLYDVGVAGVHRILNQKEKIDLAKVIIVIAGMEGALASVVGGLVDVPVIAVPTSVGYGASFKGLAALLAMLNSCAPGVVIVNIDNGFGAGYFASRIINSRI